MAHPLKVLLVEDDPLDADLLMLEVSRAGLDATWQRVETETAYCDALGGEFDLVLSDFQLPQFNGFRALELLKERGVDLPFILVSGTIGEETAVAAIRNGAADYLMKDRLARLGPAMLHAVAECQTRRERGRAEETVRLLSSAVIHARESILITDAALDLPGPRIIWANPAFTAMTGYSCNEIVGQTPRILQGPGTDPAVLQRLRDHLERGEIFEGETVNYRKDGSAFDLAWQIAPIRNRAGETTHYVALQRDVTERNRSTEALRTSESRFKALFEQTAVGVAQTDARTGCFVLVNQRFCEITGRGATELKGMSFSAITHPDDVGRGLEIFAQMKSGVLREATLEKRYLRKDGASVWLNLTISVMGAQGAPPDFLIAVAQDVTASKHLEEQFRQTQKMEALGTLAGGIAHDFNNILGAIQGYTELSQMQIPDNAVVQNYLGSVLQAADRATGLVRQILTFCRRQPMERQPIQLAPLVAEALKLLRATIPTSIEFRSHFGADTPTVFADPTQIHQIVMNLGTNALHAMGEATGCLEVSLERWVLEDKGEATAGAAPPPGAYARLIVGDTGSGMKPEIIRRIFEPFFTTKPLGEGTGLGLSVVQGIMQSHDGRVTVSSEPGKGTRFYLYFPAYAGVPSLPAEKVPLPLGKGERILFVDDEELLAQLGQATLVALGYRVEASTDPSLVLQMIQADPSRFDLVITDQSMPGMSGLVLAGKIRQIRSDLPIILSTGYNLSLTPAHLEAAGICRLLPKPASIQALGAAVQAACGALEGR